MTPAGEPRPPALPPSALGRFRIEERLGKGGMGEVYRAYDENLHRSVAVKLIRAESAGDPTARRRFRREARAAAALDHPATVKIHEIVAGGDSDAIVMELVAGTTLATLLRRGPLAAEQAIRLGIEIAGGLAAAHALGIVHRDLKTENVMVTPAGHAKILDFGLAQRRGAHAAHAPNTADTAASALSRDGVVVGTYRAMSPEQARGLALDARSDLFSFGTMLYETVAGRSPFAGPTVLATLTSLCATRQAPASTVRPEVPAALSDLIDRLLEKEPAHRPQSAAEVAAALADILGSGTAAAGSHRDDDATVVEGPDVARQDRGSGGAIAQAPAPLRLLQDAAPPRRRAVPIRVTLAALAALAAVIVVAALVVAPIVRARAQAPPLAVAVLAPHLGPLPAATPALLESSARGGLLRGLIALRGLSVISPEQIDPIAGTPAQVARATAADEVVTTALACAAGSCRVELARLRGADGKRLWQEAFEVPGEDPYRIAQAVEAHVHLGYPHHPRREGFPGLEVGADDYAEYLQIEEAFTHRRGALAAGELLDRLAGVRRRSPRFLEAAVLEAELLRYRFRDHRDAADLERAGAVLAAARRLAPAAPSPLGADFSLALETERLDRAAADVATLESLQPGDPAVLAARALLLERRGAMDPALAMLREACRRRPSWSMLMTLAGLEYRLGKSAAARRDLELLLDRAPGLYQPQSLLAQIELLSGSPARAAALYEDLVRRSPQQAEIVNLGTAYMLLRRFAAAEARFRQALDAEPANPFVLLNLADVRLLQGDRPGAAAIYRRLLDETAHDPAAGQWQLLSARAQAMAHLGQRLPAVAAAQRVLALAPGNAQADVEVALVYAVIGDQASALWNAEQALRQGVDPRWLGFPWFDALRESPELKPLLAAKPPADG
jgi:Flp pilus assembly protein TadD/tRNA A-37 threonylcarbamoyl transferase component Bud32